MFAGHSMLCPYDCKAKTHDEGSFVVVTKEQSEERFFDCVSRRFAQNQKRGTLRSE